MFLLRWTRSLLKLYFYGTFENCTWLKPQLFHPHITILCTTDAIRGFCGFNSITCSKHYKDNIEVLNRQRFTENPGVFFPSGKGGGVGGGGGGGGGGEGGVAISSCLFVSSISIT